MSEKSNRPAQNNAVTRGSAMRRIVAVVLGVGVLGFAGIIGFGYLVPQETERVPIASARSAKPIASESHTTPTSNQAAPASANSENPADPGFKRALATGAMATFVFRITPETVPDVAFKDQAGKTRTLAEWRGRTVLLNLWATWCRPCRKEMPDLNKLQAELGGEKFEVVAVSVDQGDAKKPEAFLAEMKATALKLYHDPTAKLGFKLKSIGMPTTILIGPDGKELGRLVGPAEWHSPEAVRLIKAYIPKKS